MIIAREIPAQVSKPPDLQISRSPDPAANQSMEMVEAMEVLNQSLLDLQKHLTNEVDYLLPSAPKSQQLAELLKKLFDQSAGMSTRPFGPLATLAVDGLDEETIWEELQTRVKPLLNYFENKTKKMVNRLDAVRAAKEAKLQQAMEEDSDEDDEGITEGSEESEEDGDEEQEDEEDGSEDMELDQDDEDEDNEDQDGGKRRSKKPLPNYDSDEDVKMEAWLDDFEDLENKHREKEERRQEHDDPYDDEEDDLSLVQKAMYDTDDGEDDEDDDEEEEEEIRFQDFFVADHPKKGSSKDKDSTKSKGKKVAFEEEDSEDEDDFEGEDDYQEESEEEDEEVPPSKPMPAAAKASKPSKAEQRAALHAEQIMELEQELVEKRSWELRGEVKATDRPENSLLNVVADIERATKSAPIITQEFTTNLEDLILRRIKDDNFDDPVPSHQASVKELDEDKGEDVSQEKDKKGLGDVYAEEYAKQVLKVGAETSPEVESARADVLTLFNKLSRTLDRLSHFYYAPKPVSIESNAQVLANQRLLPALAMEDSAGTAVINLQSSVTTLAHSPEEIANRPRNKVAMLRMTAEEDEGSDVKKKRRRQLKTLFKKQRAADDQKNKHTKEFQKKKLNKDLAADKRVTLSEGRQDKRNREVDPNSKSTAFFGKLQAETEQTVARKKRSRDDGDDQHSGKKSAAAAFKL